ncbi:MAG: hypothetical protein CW716_11780 [Candidatus Bathyarchaeum sp.]|nr:MAG: hypothetical protein CW716_11780 [Candidatus Bathyarchaeum sp.]
MTLKNRLEAFLRGWIPKDPNMPKKIQVTKSKTSPKPWWWKPLWVSAILVAIIFAVVSFFILDTPILNIIGGLAATALGMGFSYYIRVRPSLNVNRAIFVFLGISPIGFVLWIISTYILNKVIVTGASGTPALFLATGAVSLAVGALIGDWIGKKRHYILPLSF